MHIKTRLCKSVIVTLQAYYIFIALTVAFNFTLYRAESLCVGAWLGDIDGIRYRPI